MKITVFCGANNGRNEAYKENAIELGKWIADNNHSLVYGGGKVGLMGIIADTVLENNSEVIGIMPQFLVDREISHTGITEFIIVDDMSVRKEKLVDLGDVFVALPGGPGTLEEIAEVVSWVRVGQTNGICIFYNMEGYYDHLEAFFNHMVTTNLLSKEDRNQIHFAKSLEEIEKLIENYEKR